jgi:hypothetical protein
MTTNEEIIGTWGQIIRESDFTAWVILGRKSTNDAAIRLWRVAEVQTAKEMCKDHEMNARRKSEMESSPTPAGVDDVVVSADTTSRQTADAVCRARASERDKAKAIQILAFEQGLAEGYNREQADLIERLKRLHRKVLRAKTDRDGINAFFDGCDKILEALESASLVALTHGRAGAPANSAPENACELQYCEIHNQMTNHINEVCQKCKPESAKKKVKK